MAKIEILGPKSLFLDVVQVLHEQGKVHIEDLTRRIQSGEVPIDAMRMGAEDTRIYDELDESLIRVRSIIKTLKEPPGGIDAGARKAEYDRLWKLQPDVLCSETTEMIGEIEDRTSQLAQLHTQLESETALLQRYLPILSKIQPLAKQVVVTGSYDTTALMVERRYKSGLEALKQELNRITQSQCEIISTDVDEDTTAAIVVYAKKFAEPVHKFLAMENVNQIRLPSDFQDMPLDVAYEEIKQRQADLPAQLDQIRSELAGLSSEWYLKLVSTRDVLVDRIDEIKAIPKFGSTEYAFMILGWIPVEDFKELAKMLKSTFHDEVIVTQLDVTEKDFDEAPVAMKNPKVVTPFQGLLGVMGSPKYGTYDPTWMLAIFYPLFFGMIVGDMGYGLVMLLTVVWLRWRFKGNDMITMATGVLGPAATMAIGFGVVYAEFFGNLFTKYFNILPLIEIVNGVKVLENSPIIQPLIINGNIIWPFNRIAFTMTFLILAIAVGFVQVCLGMALGIVNGVRTKHYSHVYEKGGLLTFLLGILVLVLASVLSLEGAVYGRYVIQAVGGLMLFLGLIFAVKGGGVMGLIESLMSVGHIASYARIMAVGLAGAIFADAANGMGQALGSPVLGILIAIPLQVLNFVIAAFSPNIHAVRLNFLEFFGAFYESGSKSYEPFHKTGGE